MLLCFVLTFSFFLPRVLTSSELIHVDNCVVGSDTATYAGGLDHANWMILKVRKHSVAVVTVSLLAPPLVSLGFSNGTAAILILCSLLALGSAALCFLLSRFVAGGLAALSTLLSMSAFGSMTVFSVVETYGTTFAATCLAMVAFLQLARYAARAPIIAGIGAGIVGAVVGWANLPGAAFVLIYAGLGWPRIELPRLQRLAVLLGLPVGVAFLLLFVPVIYVDTRSGFAWERDFLDLYASWSNLVSWTIIPTYVMSFGLYSIISPLDHIRCSYTLADLSSIAGSVFKVAGLLCWLMLIVWGVSKSLRSPDRRHLTIAAVGVVAALFVFYLYFNPLEAVLYSSQWILALVVAAAPGFAGSRLAYSLVAVTLIFSLALNAPPLSDSRSWDGATCCTEPIAPVQFTNLPGQQVKLASSFSTVRCQKAVPLD